VSGYKKSNKDSFLILHHHILRGMSGIFLKMAGLYLLQRRGQKKITVLQHPWCHVKPDNLNLTSLRVIILVIKK
jgi:hypothetical protein